ncbi:response regulator [Bradymonadaceae bacterium TMQ3]|uniref:Response regulator n=1 Tax=Lujinxingia sediminis TaxID=2480984 RepID=A0ABY0CU83_9DELT|nr:response regulator [Lujinxingia sediminis]RDV37414.1 response regulator [Bradymonadaceae bacterium TMQ3]RVU45889.1 response regulator [Lujinxingia sediminis]TXC74974.1 response regulator [Bradymonadales bacterium TMQ1]
MDQRAAIDTLRERFEALSEPESAHSEGSAKIAQGLADIIGELDDEGADATRLDVIVRGLSGLADFLSARQAATTRTPTRPKASSGAAAGLEQFVEAFQQEASRRLTGLSIAMMGIFSEHGSEEALQQSTSHLHAIRGGAAMLGLKPVAEVTGTMEQVLVAMRKVEPAKRAWPTKTLLRGYALIEDAAREKGARIDEVQSDEIVQELRKTLGELGQTRQAGETKSGAAVLVPAKRAVLPGAAETAPGADAKAEEIPEIPAEVEGVAEITDVEDGPAPEVLEQRILVVDDIPTIAASVGFLLSDLEVPIDIAENGEEALQMLQEQAYSLVISDVDMPRMDGVALTRMVRSTPGLDHIPVILLTSLDHPEQRETGLKAGAIDYLIKGSIGGGELVNRVQEILTVAPYVERQETVRKQRILVAEDTETVAASIAFVLSEGPYDIVLATDGKDALSRIKQADYDLLITDMQMPYMSGTELVRAVRGLGTFDALPIVMLTSVQDEEEIAQAVSAGVNRYLIKGEIAGGKLLNLVEELLAADREALGV